MDQKKANEQMNAAKDTSQDLAQNTNWATPNTPGHEAPRTPVPHMTTATQYSIGDRPDPAFC